METIWFTSDHHFGHRNIIRYSNRPFSSVEEMDEEMIRRWNSKVGKRDRVFHLGDLGMCTPGHLAGILDRLNGKIHLIKGNHESAALDPINRDRFEWVRDYFEFKHPDLKSRSGKQKIVLLHYAMRVWNGSHHGSWHLYGHSHGSLPDDPKSLSFDAGVDCHYFYPLSYQEVKGIMEQKDWVPPFG